MSKDVSAAIVGVVVSGVALAGLIAWGVSNARATRERMAKDDPTIAPIGLFPALKVGDFVMVDTALAKLPAPFSQLPRVLCEVDMVLQDPAVVSVKTPPGQRVAGFPFFSGTIPKLAILNVVQAIPIGDV